MQGSVAFAFKFFRAQKKVDRAIKNIDYIINGKSDKRIMDRRLYYRSTYNLLLATSAESNLFLHVTIQ